MPGARCWQPCSGARYAYGEADPGAEGRIGRTGRRHGRLRVKSICKHTEGRRTVGSAPPFGCIDAGTNGKQCRYKRIVWFTACGTGKTFQTGGTHIPIAAEEIRGRYHARTDQRRGRWRSAGFLPRPACLLDGLKIAGGGACTPGRYSPAARCRLRRYSRIFCSGSPCSSFLPKEFARWAQNRRRDACIPDRYSPAARCRPRRYSRISCSGNP